MCSHSVLFISGVISYIQKNWCINMIFSSISGYLHPAKILNNIPWKNVQPSTGNNLM